ncbi:hypothetical protein QTG54_011566 [Skeletonema marinoi]|uniref:Uncharacterized protein n=1 Tax=Skeletonema marinoi TaxID=267567 RepID=A0AAD8Y250_9STRA|nr:hypothetical protein QTG54_011566 [Skeletonema marinoi]
MAERQQSQMSNLEETSNHHEVGFDLENPDRITDASEHEHENDEQYADDDTYTKRSFGCRWVTAAIVVVTILVIFLSSGTFGVAATKNQDVDKEDATTVGGGGDLGKKTSLGGEGNTEVVKIEKDTVEQKAEKAQKTEKSKKSKKSKKGGRSLLGQLSEMAMMEAAFMMVRDDDG